VITPGTDFIADSHVEDAYLGKHALRLTAATSEQMQVVYSQRGIDIPLEVSSVLHYLYKNDGASLANCSKALAIKHQLCAQRVSKLMKLGLVRKQPDPEDARRTQLVLTKDGLSQAELLVSCMEDTAEIYRDLFKEIECDLTEAIGSALAAIQRKTLSDRFAQKFSRQETAR